MCVCVSDNGVYTVYPKIVTIYIYTKNFIFEVPQNVHGAIYIYIWQGMMINHQTRGYLFSEK